MTVGPFADGGTIACSRFRDTTSGPCTGNVLAIDASAARVWTIRDNRFPNVICSTALGRAILFQGGSRDTQILRNHLTGSNMNIALGIGAPSRTYADPLPTGCSGTPDHRGGLVVCDNVIDGLSVPSLNSASFDTGSCHERCDVRREQRRVHGALRLRR